MFKTIIIIAILVSPFLIAYSTYRLTQLAKEDRKKEKRFHLITYSSSILLIICNIILWMIIESESNTLKVRIDHLMDQNVELLDGNKDLFNGNKELLNGQKNLLEQNIAISDRNESLNSKVDELKEIIIRKDAKIDDLEARASVINSLKLNLTLDEFTESLPITEKETSRAFLI